MKIIFLSAVMLCLVAPAALGHCEIPCGIYDDPMRADLLEEHIQTIEKSMKEIERLSSEGATNANQLTRWIVNKEDHANKFQEIVTQYFMTQRITPVTPEEGEAYKKYVHETTLLHQMLVSAMKCKQTTDHAHVEKLRELVAEFRKSYFGQEGAGSAAKAGEAMHGHTHGHTH
jgi:nickel superoxide dismutase